MWQSNFVVGRSGSSLGDVFVCSALRALQVLVGWQRGPSACRVRNGAVAGELALGAPASELQTTTPPYCNYTRHLSVRHARPREGPTSPT